LVYRALFDRKKRNDVQDALERGDLGYIARRLKPQAEPTGKMPEDLTLPLGMPVISGDTKIRFIGIERGKAVVMIEGPRGSRKISVKSGQRMPVKFEGDEGEAEALFLVSKENKDPSGQSVLTVRLERCGEGKP
jgi:hypothetical protein